MAEDDVRSLRERTGWAVDGAVATYEPVEGGWRARVRSFVMIGHGYRKFHIAVIDPAGIAR